MKIFYLGIFLSLLGSQLTSEIHDKMFQVAPFSSLLEGGYEGYYSVDNLMDKGDFGLGTFEGLDGEMVCYKGVYYHINSKGQARIAKKRLKLPYAQVAYFSPEYTFQAKNIRNFKLITDAISDEIKTKNLPVAILIKGTFSYMKLRSVRSQKKPYPRFEKAIREQSEYHYEEIDGYAIGFWSPQYFGTVTVTGYQFHFLSKSLKNGGYIVDMHLKEGEIQIMPLNEIELYLPKKPSFEAMKLDKATPF